MHARSLFFRHGTVTMQISSIGRRNTARCHARKFTTARRKEAPHPVRLSSWYSPTLSSDDVASIDTIDSMKILLRGGYVRQSASGTYTYLANGLRILNKITAIIDEEMTAIGASRIEMPQLLQSKLWHKTGRIEAMGNELFRFKDRRGSEMILAPTHEEEVTKLVGSDVDSHKSLPVRVYQVGRKFRDEPRPYSPCRRSLTTPDTTTTHSGIARLQAILLSRFYLNLREANSCSLVDGGLSDTSQVSDIRFDRVVGPLAGSVVYVMDSGPEADDDAEDVDVDEGGSS